MLKFEEMMGRPSWSVVCVTECQLKGLYANFTKFYYNLYLDEEY